jgi:lysophospholipase L1-like esterase
MRIMPLGDSITQADSSHDSYRRPLWKLLQSGGYRVEFVGSENENHRGGPPIRDFDLDHEGHWGWRTDEVLSNIGSWARAARPDVVLLHLGTNDALEGESPASTVSEIERIIDRLREANATVTVLVAKVIPTANTSWNRDIERLNTEISPIASRKSTPTSIVTVIDQFSGFDGQRDTYDGVHPNAGGESRMANRWFQSLEPILKQRTATVSPP